MLRIKDVAVEMFRLVYRINSSNSNNRDKINTMTIRDVVIQEIHR